MAQKMWPDPLLRFPHPIPVGSGGHTAHACCTFDNFKVAWLMTRDFVAPPPVSQRSRSTGGRKSTGFKPCEGEAAVAAAGGQVQRQLIAKNKD